MMNLETDLRIRIARLLGISQDEVTEDLIRQKREELYADPNHKFFVDGTRGGYNADGLEMQNQTEVEAEIEEAIEFLGQFADEK